MSLCRLDGPVDNTQMLNCVKRQAQMEQKNKNKISNGVTGRNSNGYVQGRHAHYES